MLRLWARKHDLRQQRSKTAVFSLLLQVMVPAPLLDLLFDGLVGRLPGARHL
jgi:hypothetical protein